MHTTFRVGHLTCHALEGGRQRLDGGAMFGVVPKVLWERRIPSDERNRIPLALRCLLVEHDDGLVLIDTGIGNKENEKFRDIYGVDNAGAQGRTRLEDALGELGHKPDDVRWVINTHLHFDHAGGDTYRDGAGKIELSFPKARYVVQRRELEFAQHTNERTAGSYLGHNFASVLFQLIDGETEILADIRGIPKAVANASAFWRISCPRRRMCRCRGSWATIWSRSSRSRRAVGSISVPRPSSGS